jgi:deazaflavin-dependent oxidoreductase (nitroreductase family)
VTGPPTGNIVWRAFAWVVSIKPLSLFFMHLAAWVDRPLMRLTTGRIRLSFVVPMLLLSCRGAKSGLLREVPLLYVPDGDHVLLMGSNGGQTHEPAWCHNLRHEPRVSCALKGRVRKFRARELCGAEREEAWRGAVAVYPGYDRYAQRVERLIPVFRLVPEGPES